MPTLFFVSTFPFYGRNTPMFGAGALLRKPAHPGRAFSIQSGSF